MKIIFGNGLVAQWTRARGYEPRCQGFESLPAQFPYLKNIKTSNLWTQTLELS